MTIPHTLGLRAGDWVVVRSESEILSTLDDQSRLDGLPFMPEMLAFCGSRLRVFRRADKTCDTITSSGSRRMRNTVHLAGVRCDGSDHGGCQAGCLVFWKESWLKRPDAPDAPRTATTAVTREALAHATIRTTTAPAGEPAYVCQATELLAASAPLPWWDVRQYVRELWSGNVSLRTFVSTIALAAFNAVQRRRGGAVYPQVQGNQRKTPSRTLDLRAGERVRVRPLADIVPTLSPRRRNRGLLFDPEMVPFCGGEYQVERRVERIIDERTGVMHRLPGECIVLEGVACGGCLSRNRLFCSRSIPPYWREIWLERVT